MNDSELLQTLRKTLKIKQTDFAERLSTTQGHISDIENGRKFLSDRTIKLICLQSWNGKFVNEEWLRTGQGKMFRAIEGDEFAYAISEIDVHDPRAKQAILDYWHLNSQEKELFWRFVDTFVKRQH